MKIKKQLIAMFLIIAMVFSITPVPAFSKTISKKASSLSTASVADDDNIADITVNENTLKALGAGLNESDSLVNNIDLLSEDKNADRYTVLVLDISSSSDFLGSSGQVFYTADTALSYVKTASMKFLNAIINADGNNYIALVTFNSQATVVSGFTSDINALTNSINGLESSESVRSISGGLEAANALLSSVTGNVKRNVVIFSTGMTNDGPYDYSGKYDEDTVGSIWYRQDTSVRLYAYANAAVASAQNLADNDINVYSIGLFQTMENMPEEGKNVVSLFKLTAKDIASSSDKYYEVYDVNKLEFIFGEVAEDVIDPTVDNDPIIIIPGVMGSRLFNSDTTFNDSTRIWDPVIGENVISFDTVSALLKLKNSVTGDLHVRPCEEQHQYTDAGTATHYGREYGALEMYRNTVDTLCEKFPDRPVYVFSYDWRMSNKISAQSLNNAINTILKDNNTDKVDLLCHSMGGLVASSYYQQYTDRYIDKIVTCGTPYEGAAKLLNSVITIELLDDDMKNNALRWIGGLNQDTKASFDGVAQLTPTKNYHDKMPMFRDDWKPFNIGDYALTYDKYKDICYKIFTKDRFDNAVNFQESLHGANGLNALLDFDRSYFCIGINHPTITSIKFQFSNTDIDEVFYESDLNYETSGDGTVPFYSSTMSEAITKLDSSRWATFNADHGETITSGSVNDGCLKWITDILDKGRSGVDSDKSESRPYTVIRIACPVDVIITKGNESLVYNTIDKKANYNVSFGRLDIIGKDSDIKMLCVYTDDDYKLTLNGTNVGTLDYSIRFYDQNDELIDERMFEDVPLTPNTVITTDADQDEKTVLHVDTNGDGKEDESWTGENNVITSSKDHQHESSGIVKENIKDATCTENGSYEAVEYCISCNKEISRNKITTNTLGHDYLNGVCKRCGNNDPNYIPVPEHTHTPGNEVTENAKPATCVNNGSYDQVTYCTICREELLRKHFVIKATGHKSHNPVIENEAKPTCTKGGSYEKVVFCKVCEKELSRTRILTAKLGHSWNKGVITKKPTYKKTGTKTYTCKRCGAEKIVKIAKLPRIIINNWDIKIMQNKKKLIVKVYSNGKKINSKYYSVSYGKLVKNKKVNVTIKGKDKYIGTIKLSFKVK